MAAMIAPPPSAGNSNYLLVPHPAQSQRSTQGILLNGCTSSPASSVQNSPRRNSYYLPIPASGFSSLGATRSPSAGPSSVSSHSSSSSSSSDDIASSSAHSGSDSLSNSISRAAGRKIRFAPLPDPRRDVFVAEDGSEIPASEVFGEALSQEASVPALTVSCSSAAATTPTHLSPGFTNYSSNPLHASASSLGLYGDDALSISGQSVSTITGGGSATHLPLEKSVSRGSVGSASAPSSPKRSRWTRLLRIPKKTSASKLSAEFSSSLFRTSSRDSSNSTVDDIAEKHRGPERRQSTGSVGFSAQESRNAFKMGLPLTPVVSESGTSAAPTNRPPQVGANAYGRRGTRLLNGRRYGYSGARSGRNGVKDLEPEFVEWGHGGMGSVQANSGHKSEWSKLQSSRKLSVGHNEGDGVDEEDDGSGMGWVKRRRAQREKEQKEGAESTSKADKVEENVDAADAEAKEADAALETPSIVVRSASPHTTAGEEVIHGGDKAEHEDSSAKAGSSAKHSTAETTSTAAKDGAPHSQDLSSEHVYTTVKIPTTLPKHHHHHRDLPHRSSSTGSSQLATPVSEHVHPNIFAGSSSTSSSATMLPLAGIAGKHVPSPLSDSASSGILDETKAKDPLPSPGAASVSSSSSTDDSDSDEEDEVEREEEEEDDDEDEDEVVPQDEEEARKTSISAGVEKVSKHKE